MNDKDAIKLQEECSELFAKRDHAINMNGAGLRDSYISWYEFCEWAKEKNPFGGYLYVPSADAYMALPWSKRSVWLFWYKNPLITGGTHILGGKKDREALDNFIQGNHPLQYYIRKKGFHLKCKLIELKDWIRYTINPRQKWLTKKIPKHWSDKTYLIPELNFAMVVDFIEGEKALDVTDWVASSEGADQFSKELVDCYEYIKRRRPKIQEDLDNSYPDEDTMTGDYFTDYAELNKLEILLNKEDTKYLTWIVVNRDYFWT